MIHSRQGVRYSIAVLRMGVLSISISGQSFILRHSHSSPLARITFNSSKPSLPSKLVTMSATRCLMCYVFHLGPSTHMSRVMSAQEKPPTPFIWGPGKRGPWLVLE